MLSPRWLALYVAGPLVVVAVAALWYFAGAAPEAAVDPPRSFIFLDQHDAVLRSLFQEQAACLRQKCSPFLAECARREQCLEVLDGVLGDRCREIDEACAQHNLSPCPASVSNLWGCWRAFCRIGTAGFQASGAYKLEGVVQEPDFARIYAARDLVAADDRAAGLAGEHERNFGESGAGAEGGEVYDSHGHNTAYLHTRLEEAFPGLVERLLGVARRADEERGWGVWARLRSAGIEAPSVRCVELITYDAGSDHGGNHSDDQSIGWHFDTGSLLTVAVMLSAQGRDYEGGGFELRPSREDCSPDLRHTLAPGDVLVWESWRPHRVAPVTRGRRAVLVVELWEFGNTTDPTARRPDVPEDFRQAGVHLWGLRYGWAWRALFAHSDNGRGRSRGVPS